MIRKIFYIILLATFIVTPSFATLRIGTTGDYPPFSSYNFKTKSYTGKDITLIKQFAKADDEKVVFVKTTWADSESDLQKHKFDIFVGGMSITDKRKKLFVYSTPLIIFHKAAMTQCKDLKKYDFYSDVDNHKNLIVVNRGGLNEKVARSRLKRAKLLVINDNQAAIKSIIDGIGVSSINGIKPDIMILDDIEIKYQHSINPKLCLIPINFETEDRYKAFMFNKSDEGKILANKFNKWLKNNPKVLKNYQNQSY